MAGPADSPGRPRTTLKPGPTKIYYFAAHKKFGPNRQHRLRLCGPPRQQPATPARDASPRLRVRDSILATAAPDPAQAPRSSGAKIPCRPPPTGCSPPTHLAMRQPQRSAAPRPSVAALLQSDGGGRAKELVGIAGSRPVRQCPSPPCALAPRWPTPVLPGELSGEYLTKLKICIVHGLMRVSTWSFC